MSAPAVVQASGLAVGYGVELALRDVTFAVPAGRLVAVIGPNGGGKTTLLRALLGELEPSAGTCSVAGEVAYVPQSEHARLDFPVAALDVALMGAYGRTPWHRRIARADRAAAQAALERLGLGDRMSDGYGALSRGQRQRVMLARALVRDAPVLLLDEPFAGVDARSGEVVTALLEELRDEGRTLLIATHDFDQARRWDDALCLNGRQVAFGPARDVLGPDTLAATFGAELVVLEGGTLAVPVQHHDHEHGP